MSASATSVPARSPWGRWRTSCSLGELDEALRIRKEEQLPVYERLGDVQGLIVARAMLAQYLAKRNHEGDLGEAIELVEQSIGRARPLRLGELPAFERFLAKLRARQPHK